MKIIENHEKALGFSVKPTVPSDQKTKKSQKYLIKPYAFKSFANLEKDRFPYFLRKTNRIPYENLAKTKENTI